MRKQVSLILAMMLFMSLAVPGLADEPAGGKCGDNLTWSLGADGILTISGTGPMYDYNYEDSRETAPWAAQGDLITSAALEKGVTSIGKWAFANCSRLTGVTIPSSVVSIGNNAFYNCASLTAVTIPRGVTAVEADTFRECGSLKSVDIPDSVTIIRASAFYGCGSLSSVIIPDGVTAIEGAAFYNCTNLAGVTIPSSVTSIGMEAFSYCENLTDVYYGGSGEQWARIDFGSARYNAKLLGANIHCSDTGGAVPSTPGGISVTVGGKAVAWTDAEPFIDANDRTMVPLRAVADAMGLTVNWDAAAREASFTGGSRIIIFPIDSATARTSDGGAVQMDTAAVIVSDRTYAPIRYLAEFFGHEVGWDGAAQTVIIKLYYSVF